jgi:hypothetical protein
LESIIGAAHLGAVILIENDEIMLKISLRNFLETGDFGPIILGQHRDVVESLLGTPDDWSVDLNKQGKPKIWKYGDIGFYFDDLGDCVYMIFSDDFRIPMGGKNIDLDPWILNNQLTLEEALKIMHEHGIAFQEKQFLNDIEYRCFKTCANVNLAFSSEYEERFYLYSFWIWKELDKESG